VNAGGRKPLYCRGCGRHLAYAYVTKIAIYCKDLTCHQLPDADPQDVRDDIIRLMFWRGHSAKELAEIFGLSRQRIEQIGYG
jgi:hypothetical protein